MTAAVAPVGSKEKPGASRNCDHLCPEGVARANAIPNPAKTAGAPGTGIFSEVKVLPSVRGQQRDLVWPEPWPTSREDCVFTPEPRIAIVVAPAIAGAGAGVAQYAAYSLAPELPTLFQR